MDWILTCWFQWSFFLLRLPSISINWLCSLLWNTFVISRLAIISVNSQFSLLWNTFVISRLVLQITTWRYWIRHKNGYARQLVLHLLLGSLSKCSQPKPFLLVLLWKCLSELAELVPLLYFCRWSICYSNRLHDFFCHHS